MLPPSLSPSSPRRYSPDRVDPLCFALSELLLGETCEAWLEYLRQEVAIARGKMVRPKITSAPQPQTIVERPRPTITLRAPGPHMHYAPSKGKRYSSNAEGVIKNVEIDDLPPLLAGGCSRT